MYSKLVRLLEEEMIFFPSGDEEIACIDLTLKSQRPTDDLNHQFTDPFCNPILEYIEPDRIITLFELKRRLLNLFVPWRTTKEALDAVIAAVESGRLESRVYYCAAEKGEPEVGCLLGLWYSHMPKDARMPLETNYGNHEFEVWLSGTRPGMSSENTPYLSQLLFVLQDIRSQLFDE